MTRFDDGLLGRTYRVLGASTVRVERLDPQARRIGFRVLSRDLPMCWVSETTWMDLLESGSVADA